ncbi:MAG: hypothetical protein ACUVQF_06590 [Fervidobacterium sp.]|uniref:hypothetical protein n=1 Tax=Fervidobacterium sp. TaxID=1871331 RepID=UPI00404A77AF
MKKLVVLAVALLAVFTFAVDFKLSFSGWMETGFTYEASTSTLKWGQYGEISVDGFYPLASDADFVFKLNGINLINSPTNWSNDGSLVSQFYVMYKPEAVPGLTVSVGKRSFGYGNVWGDVWKNPISSNRLTAVYTYDFLTARLGMFSQDTFQATDVRFFGTANFAKFGVPVTVHAWYDVKSEKWGTYVYGSYEGKAGTVGYWVNGDIEYAKLTGDATVTLGAVKAGASIDKMDFGAQFNYHKLIVGAPAEFGAWFNYTIDAAKEFKLNTYFETDTDFSYVYAKVATPYKFSKNVTATPKVEFNEKGLTYVSYKLKASF